MSFWDFSLENTGRTQIVSIQYQEQYGRAKKPVFMRVFAVSSVIPIQWAPAGGSNPRGFSLSPSGKWLLAAGQNSGSLTVMKRDEKTGMLKPERTYEAGAVVCLLFGN